MRAHTVDRAAVAARRVGRGRHVPDDALTTSGVVGSGAVCVLPLAGVVSSLCAGIAALRVSGTVGLVVGVGVPGIGVLGVRPGECWLLACGVEQGCPGAMHHIDNG